MNEQRIIKVSKYLSRHLRHAPERIGLTLQPAGWVGVDELLSACNADGMRLTRPELEEVVANNNKQRFSFDETGQLIRANQGHSVEVDLGLAPTTPPDVLFHGTGHTTVEVIRREGLKKQRRHHVHLSRDVETATAVGARHGKPFVFVVDARAMHAAGYSFYVSNNGVWLTDEVPPEYLSPAGER